jgi:hypothetical protein
MDRTQVSDDSPRRSGVFGALDNLDSDLNYSVKLAEELELKLSGVLRNPSATDATCKEGSQPRNVSSVTTEVEGINYRVRALNVRLSELLERLDV